ncbi:IclR family transcriptional regulator, partial [Streptomyces griseiscabiei]|uniref:hypothetical protein n=1 Tax=Streptomyces griseiscabiei TaxID=2993540 RepID=UPI003873A0E0
MSIDIPQRPTSSAYWSPPAVPPVLAAMTDSRQPPQSAGRGFRVLRALLRLGADQEHQLADIARAAGLQPSHASKLLKAAALEHLVESGTRRGTYRLARDAAPLTPDPTGTAATTEPVRRIVEDLQHETGLATAWHEPRFRLGLGLHLTLIDLACPLPGLRTAAAQQHDDLRATAAGRQRRRPAPRPASRHRGHHPLHPDRAAPMSRPVHPGHPGPVRAAPGRRPQRHRSRPAVPRAAASAG